jgi:predicted SprT family Zn-dependent metalloprotease
MFSLEAETLAKKLISELAPGYTFAWDRSERRFGCCKPGKRLITLSLGLVQQNPVEVVMDTILHEIAHARAGCGHGHDYVWQQMCIKLGCKPVRCYGEHVVRPTGNYAANCGCGAKHEKIQMPRKRSFICRNCRQPLVYHPI